MFAINDYLTMRHTTMENKTKRKLRRFHIYLFFIFLSYSNLNLSTRYIGKKKLSKNRNKLICEIFRAIFLR
jgi:hypothetical protein